MRIEADTTKIIRSSKENEKPKETATTRHLGLRIAYARSANACVCVTTRRTTIVVFFKWPSYINYTFWWKNSHRVFIIAIEHWIFEMFAIVYLDEIASGLSVPLASIVQFAKEDRVAYFSYDHYWSMNSIPLLPEIKLESWRKLPWHLFSAPIRVIDGAFW